MYSKTKFHTSVLSSNTVMQQAFSRSDMD